MKRKSLNILLAVVMVLSVGLITAVAAPASSPLVTETQAAWADSTDSTVTTSSTSYATTDTITLNQGALDTSQVIMRWTEKNVTSPPVDLECMLASILIKEGAATLIDGDIDLYWAENPGGTWYAITEEYYTDVPLGYDSEWVMGPAEGFDLGSGDQNTFWIRADINDDLVAPVIGQVVIFSDEEGGTDRRYDAGEQVASADLLTTLDVMYTAEVSHSSPMFYADDDGTTTDPIQAAIVYANPGNTVIVHPGIYQGLTVDIDKSLTLETASGHWDEVNDIDTVIQYSDSPVILIDADPFRGFVGHVTISGFEIFGGEDGIEIEGLSHGASLTVNNCFIWGNSGDGILCEQPLDGGLTVDDCVIAENGSVNSDGIHLDKVKGGTVVITNNIIGAGMFCSDCPDMLLGNEYDGIDVEYINCTGTVIIGPGNIIAENGDQGIDIDEVDGNLTIIENIIGAWDFAPAWEEFLVAAPANGDPGFAYGNGDDGIYIHSTSPSSSVLIQDNKIHENGTDECDGIEMDYVDGSVDILDNIIGAWTYYVPLSEASQDFGGNDCDGIDIDDVDGTVLIDGNRIADNGDQGIEIDDIQKDSERDPCLDSCVRLHGSVTISNNYVGAWTDEEQQEIGSDSQSTGICIGDDSDVDSECTLTIGPNNTVYDNGNTGIYVCDVSSGADATIFDNFVSENGTGLYGIRLCGSDGVIVDGNEVTLHSDGGGKGIYLCDDCDCNSIINNIVTDNDVGIYLSSDSDNNGIVGNWVCDNIEDGLVVWGDNNDILRNVFSGNVGGV